MGRLVSSLAGAIRCFLFVFYFFVGFDAFWLKGSALVLPETVVGLLVGMLFFEVAKVEGIVAVFLKWGCVFFVFAADDVVDGLDDFGEGVDLIGDGQFVPFFDLSFELFDFFLVLSLSFAAVF